MAPDDPSEIQICIVGTGELARALGARFQRYGVPFCFGSRQPEQKPRGLRKEVLEKGSVRNVDEACLESDVIILAIHRRHYELLRTDLANKILIDVSNESGEPSSERLASMFPKCTIIKAFNTVSARTVALEDESPRVYVCGDDDAARRMVIQIAARSGFSPVDYGPLSNRGTLEDKVQQLFPGWGWPCLVVMVISAFWIVFTTCRAFKLRQKPYSADRLPTNVANKIVGAIAATCLAMVYFPGCVVALAQLVNGRKNVQLPRLLDGWLSMRQKLGIFALLLAALHMILSLALISPAYFPNWYPPAPYHLSNQSAMDAASGARMTWVGETVILFGALAITTLLLIGIATLPSISATLSWREWRCAQSHVGFLCLLFTTCHVTMKGAPVWLDKSVKDVIPTVSFLSSLLPWLTVGLRLVLYTPCLYKRLDRIRSGRSEKSERLPAAEQPEAKTEAGHNADDLSVVV